MDPELRLMAIKGKVALDSFGKTIEDAVEHYLEFLREEKAKEESQTRVLPSLEGKMAGLFKEN